MNISMLTLYEILIFIISKFVILKKNFTNMLNFEFKNPTKIIFGKGEIAKISREIPKTEKILVLYGGGSIKSNGVYDQVNLR